MTVTYSVVEAEAPTINSPCIKVSCIKMSLGVGAMFTAAGLGGSGATSTSPFFNARRETIKSF